MYCSCGANWLSTELAGTYTLRSIRIRRAPHPLHRCHRIPVGGCSRHDDSNSERGIGFTSAQTGILPQRLRLYYVTTLYPHTIFPSYIPTPYSHTISHTISPHYIPHYIPTLYPHTISPHHTHTSYMLTQA